MQKGKPVQGNQMAKKPLRGYSSSVSNFQQLSLTLLFSYLRKFNLWPKLRTAITTATSISTILTVLSFNEEGVA